MMVAELGGAAMHSGLQTRGVAGFRGRITPEQIRATARTGDPHHVPRASVVTVENTHNNAGGAVWPVDELEAVVSTARDLGLAVHLDGARLANAAVAAGVGAAELARGFDTVTLCLSKGLGCPLGAVIGGSHELMARARVEKHRFGGAMRQAGIVAAAGLYALEHNVERLAEDHANAERLASGLRDASYDVASVNTNMVLVRVSPEKIAGLKEQLEKKRILILARPLLRLVTHLDIDAKGIDTAIAAFGAARN